MGENNAPTALKGCGVKTKYLDKAGLTRFQCIMTIISNVTLTWYNGKDGIIGQNLHERNPS